MPDDHPTDDDLVWLRATLGGWGSGADQRVLIRPTRENAELILPLESPRAAAAAVRRHHDGRTVSQRLQTVAAELLARSGKLHLGPGETTELEPFTLVERLAEHLGEPELLAAITLGPRRRNRKPVIQLLRPDGSAVGFAKIGWSTFTRELVANERDWLRRVEGRLPAGLTAPTVVFDDEVGDALVVVTSPLTTSRLSYRRGALPIRTVVDLARSTGSSVTTLAELPWLDQLRAVDLIDVDRLVDRHGTTRLEVGLWHGDLTRWNTATTRSGGTLVWDWEFADDHRPIGFDLLHQEFESVRRRRRRTEHDGVVAVIDAGPMILTPLGQSSSATIDLYLAELIHREARLQGEGWDPSNLGPLDTVAADALARRLR